MKLSIDVKTSGLIFQNAVLPERVIKPSIDTALKVGLEALREFTPADTGNARRGWVIAKPNQLRNDVSYIEFLDLGTRHMAPRNITLQARPVAERNLVQALEQNVSSLS